jgi:hypothetical protein
MGSFRGSTSCLTFSAGAIPLRLGLLSLALHCGVYRMQIANGLPMMRNELLRTQKIPPRHDLLQRKGAVHLHVHAHGSSTLQNFLGAVERQDCRGFS